MKKKTGKTAAREKIDPQRQQEAEMLRGIIGRSKAFFFGGIAVSLIGCILSGAIGSDLLLWIFQIPGFILIFIGYFMNLRQAICPGCGKFIGAKPSIANRLPERCPHCGRKW